MYLKSIEVQGFKSFANKISFEFNNGITGIVGPNGSGKSNVADAVRWVLGEQRIKQLIGASMQDVIFSGTQLRKPVGSAYVAITLDNSDHALAIDFDEVCVRVGKMLNIIAGDGKTNVLELNTLDYNVWNGSKYLQKQGWQEKYISGFQRLEGLADQKGKYTKYNFDLVLANPPFAGDRTDAKVIGLYQLGYNEKVN